MTLLQCKGSNHKHTMFHGFQNTGNYTGNFEAVVLLIKPHFCFFNRKSAVRNTVPPPCKVSEFSSCCHFITPSIFYALCSSAPLKYFHGKVSITLEGLHIRYSKHHKNNTYGNHISSLEHIIYKSIRFINTFYPTRSLDRFFFFFDAIPL